MSIMEEIKPIQITSATKEQWANIILKLDVEYVAVTIDCHDHCKRKKHYIKNISKVIDPQKTIFDMTNYPGYVIIYMSSDNDLSTLCETYNSIYKKYGEITQIEIMLSRFYKPKDSDDYSNVVEVSRQEMPISSHHFDNFKYI